MIHSAEVQWGVTAAAAAIVIGSGLMAAPTAAAPGGWTEPQRIGEAVSVAVSADGTGALLGIQEDNEVRAARWTGTRWGKPKVVTDRDADYGVAPQVELSADGRRALLAWYGQANEGVSPIYASVRKKGGWTPVARIGKGYGPVRLSADGSRALAVWVMEDEEGDTDGLTASWWDGAGWSHTQLQATSPDTTPVIALSQDGGRAVAAWSQSGAVRTSWWSQGQWSAPAVSAPGATVHQVAITDDGATATLVASRTTAAGIELLRRSGSPAGWGAPTTLGTIPATPARVRMSADGGTGALVYVVEKVIGGYLFDNRFVLAWEGAALAGPAFGLGVGRAADIAVSQDGSTAIALWSPEDIVAPRAVNVSTWRNGAWSSPAKVGRCYTWGRNEVDLSGSGAVAAGVWSCTEVNSGSGKDGDVYAVRSPAPPARVKGLRASVQATSAHKGRAVIRWRAAANAVGYEVKLSRPGGKRFPAQWREITARKYTKTVALDRTYRVKVRGANAGGPGQVSTLRFAS